MPVLGGCLPPVLGDAEIAGMEEAAFGVLEHVGLAVSRDDMRRGLEGQPGVRVDGQRVYLAPWRTGELVEERRCRPPRRPASGAERGFTIYSGGHGLNILEPGTELARPLTCDDLVAATRLVECLRDRGLRGGAPGIPADVPAPLRQLRQFRITLENCQHRGAPALNDVATAEAAREMCDAVGASFSTGVHVVSPLRLEANEVDIAMHYRAENLPLSVGTMPTAGVTAPVQPVGLFVQAMAEVMGGYAVFRMLGFDRASFWVNAYPADMRTLSITFGSPEHIICDLMQMAINAHYSGSAPAKGLLTMSKLPDMQAAADAATHTAVLALAGATSFCDAGTLSLDEVYSPEKLVIDLEIADYALRLARGFSFDEGLLDWQGVASGVEQGTFMAEPDTLRHHRAVYWVPRLFTHELLGQWQAAGARSLRQRAVEAVAEARKTYDYALPADQSRELDRIYRHAEGQLLG
ncbi:MAG: trimethylamine methyltransferase family protein [Anaerolineae bacterium]